MIFSRAALTDLPAIAALEAEGFDTARWSAEAWQAEIEGADRHVLVARQAATDEVVGVATFQVVADAADLHRVVVRGDHRGRGIGRRLVRAGVDWAEARGADRMLLEVESENEAALGLYTALGFQPIARRSDYYAPGLHALVMELPLGRESAALGLGLDEGALA